MEEKLTRDVIGRTKLIRDQLGSPVPQLWDSINNCWVVNTGQLNGGGGPVNWDSITDKPSTFTPSAHVHEISDINGLQDILDELRKAIGGGGNVGGNNTILELFKIDDHDILGIENFDVTNTNQEDWVQYGDGSNEHAPYKPANPAVLHLLQNPSTISIKLKEEHKDWKKYINFYDENGRHVDSLYNKDFDANGQVVLNRNESLLQDVFRLSKVYISLTFESPIDEDGDGWGDSEMRYWVDFIIE